MAEHLLRRRSEPLLPPLDSEEPLVRQLRHLLVLDRQLQADQLLEASLALPQLLPSEHPLQRDLADLLQSQPHQQVDLCLVRPLPRLLRYSVPQPQLRQDCLAQPRHLHLRDSQRLPVVAYLEARLLLHHQAVTCLVGERQLQRPLPGLADSDLPQVSQ